MTAEPTLQLGEICARLGVPERPARYVLERGLVPPGIDKSPASGNHRRFGPGQAFWLALALTLRHAGLRTPLAAKVADYATLSLRTVCQQLVWDWQFSPSQGRFATEHQHFVEVGDL